MNDKQAIGRVPPPEAIEEARRHPGEWIYEILGSYGPDEDVPPHAIHGVWKVDQDGKIVGEFIPNPSFQEPSQ